MECNPIPAYEGKRACLASRDNRQVPGPRNTVLGEMSVEDSEALRDRLRAMSDEELLASATAGTPPTGLGATSTFSLGVDKVFVKRLPLTDIEAAHPYSTRNHFELPTFYSYGVGSAGFGAWRELAALQAVSGLRGCQFTSIIG